MPPRALRSAAWPFVRCSSRTRSQTLSHRLGPRPTRFWCSPLTRDEVIEVPDTWGFALLLVVCLLAATVVIRRRRALDRRGRFRSGSAGLREQDQA